MAPNPAWLGGRHRQPAEPDHAAELRPEKLSGIVSHQHPTMMRGASPLECAKMGIMSRIPNFADIAFEKAAVEEPQPCRAVAHARRHPVKPSYSEADLDGVDFLETWRESRLSARTLPDMYVNQP